jgi:hypothetical protein
MTTPLGSAAPERCAGRARATQAPPQPRVEVVWARLAHSALAHAGRKGSGGRRSGLLVRRLCSAGPEMHASWSKPDLHRPRA